MKKIIFFIIAICSFLSSTSQNETNNWIFGDLAGLSFSSGSPVPLSGSAMTTTEGSAVASHPITGNLLFYSDGSSVWDNTNTIMPSGSGLLGCSSSTMAALAVPQPGSADIYYLFTTDCAENIGANGFMYSIIDMTANSGLGDVTSPNNLLFNSCGEVNHAVKHSNCIDYWIVARELNNNNYRTYLLTSAGLSAPVITSIGTPASIYHYGQGKFSPDGTKFAVADGQTQKIQLFDFNTTTGVFTNPISLFSSSGTDIPYGLSFSSDNSKLYACAGSSGELIYQWNLSSGVPATIIASQMLIANVSPYFYPQLQLGKDYKLYISDFGGSTLSVITSPNTAGIACNFVASAVPIGGINQIGLPEFPENYFNSSTPCITFAAISAQGDDLLCANDSGGIAWVSLYNITPPYTISWSPGGMGTDTISGLSAGTYYVAVVNSAGVSFSDSITITQPAALTASIYTATDTVCSGSSVTLSATGSGGTGIYTYQWTTISGSGTGSPYTFGPTASDTVDLLITDENGCIASSDIYITVLTLPPINISTADTCICAGESVTLSASGTPSFLWSNGSTSASITVAPSAASSYIVSYSNGVCATKDTVDICVNPLPIVIASNDTSITYGSEIEETQLTSSGTGSLIWSPSTGLSCIACPNPIASPSSSQVYTVTYTNSFGCAASETVIITVDYLFTIPNVFTPNNDAENETFFIRNLPPSTAIRMYNRWGNLLFESSLYANDWTTKVDGVYYYVLETKDGKVFSGFVQVLGNN